MAATSRGQFLRQAEQHLEELVAMLSRCTCNASGLTNHALTCSARGAGLGIATLRCIHNVLHDYDDATLGQDQLALHATLPWRHLQQDIFAMLDNAYDTRRRGDMGERFDLPKENGHARQEPRHEEVGASGPEEGG